MLSDLLMFIGERHKEDSSKEKKKEPLVRQQNKQTNRKVRCHKCEVEKVFPDGTGDHLGQMLLIGQIE